MRQQLIEALMYPRLLLQQLIDDHQIHHDNKPDSTDIPRRRWPVELREWEGRMDEFTNLDRKTDEILSHNLREGIKFVEALHSHLRHDETTSTFEYCNWIRNAEHLLEEMEHHLPHVEAAALHAEH